MLNSIMHKKSQIWVSAVLYTLVAAVSIAFILQAGMPLIEGMRDRSVFTKMKNQMLVLDQHIEQVASEGRGSQRFVPFEIAQGDVVMDDAGFRWEMDTETKIVEPRSSYKVGNLIISANSDVSAEEYTDYYLLKNSQIEVKFLKNGTSASPANLTTSELVQSITILDTNTTITPSFNFKVAGDDASMSGEGYTSLSAKGTLLGSASYIAHMSTSSYKYDLFITLDGEADFIRAEIKNFVPN
jgi:hypothetical protein